MIPARVWIISIAICAGMCLLWGLVVGSADLTIPSPLHVLAGAVFWLVTFVSVAEWDLRRRT